MIPLVDTHCHLLAGLDDGPRMEEDALEMCRNAAEEGISLVAATAHQNERWRDVTPERIRSATVKLARALAQEGIPLTVFPCAEVMVHPGLVETWQQGNLLSVADREEYLLLEMPNGLFVDLRETVHELRTAGVCPILAHPERHTELLHEPGEIERLVHAGCLVQVSSDSITELPSRQYARALKDWFRRGVVHLVGTDAHSPRRRPPRMVEAYRRIAQWAGASVADRVCSTNGMAILQGLPLRIAPPARRGRRWFAFLSGRRDSASELGTGSIPPWAKSHRGLERLPNKTP